MWDVLNHCVRCDVCWQCKDSSSWSDLNIGIIKTVSHSDRERLTVADNTFLYGVGGSEENEFILDSLHPS